MRPEYGVRDLDTWKIIEENPFFTPLTVEEIEENSL
jgi:hypothetical protein